MGLNGPTSAPVVGRRSALWVPRSAVLTYDDEVLADSPDHYWKLDETTGVYADSVGTLDATVIGTVNRGVAGPATGVLAADLAGGYLKAADTFMHGRAQFTVEAWVNADSFTSQSAIVGDRHGNTTGFSFQFFLRASAAGSPDVIFYVNGGGSRDTTNDPTTRAALTWWHYAVTYDGVSVKRYVNGVETGTALATTFGTVQAVAPGTGRGGGIGCTLAYDTGGDVTETVEQLLDGRIAKVAVYPTGLSAARLLAHYNAMVG